MEFDLDNQKVIGVIDHKLGVDSARIKIIGLIDQSKTIVEMSEQQATDLFPPRGFIFGPSFFNNKSFSGLTINDVISFYIEENVRVEEGKDIYKLHTTNHNVKNLKTKARNISGFKRNDYTTDLNCIKVEDDNSDGDFYGVTDKYIIGLLRMKNGKIESVLPHRIKQWDIDESNILKYKNIIRLKHEPNGDFHLLDCMDNKQLFDWFRDKLKLIEPGYVKLLDAKAKWRTEIPNYFSVSNEDECKIDKIRFKRFNEKIRYFEILSSEIKDYVEKSDALGIVFKETLENHKLELKRGYLDELEEYKLEIEKQKNLLFKEINSIQLEIDKKKKNLNEVDRKITDVNSKFDEINKNKERIIADFAIIKDVLNFNGVISQNNSMIENSFVVEFVNKHNENNHLFTKDEFILSIKYQLSNYNLYPNFANKLLEVICIYKAIFIKDIRLGIAFAEATGNSKYIIQHVEPDWLHFKDFWQNGLGELWQSAFNNPNQMHFLLLEDINFSSPECYAKPLLDVISGVRKCIPFAKIEFPNNLKILATKSPTENPSIGLPLYKQTFSGWGAVGFSIDIYKKDNVDYLVSTGYITQESFENFKLDEFGEKNIKDDVLNEYIDLFDEI